MNNTAADFPSRSCLHELFETSRTHRPDAPAVIVTGAQYSYAELEERANRLAHELRGLGVGPDGLVGSRREKSFEMVIGLVAIAKAGGAYVPMDPAYPEERLCFMQRTPLKVLLTQGDSLIAFPRSERDVVCLDDEWDSDRRETPRRKRR